MENHDDGGTRFIRRIEELLQRSTLPPEAVLNMLRRADTTTGKDPIREFERLQNEQRGEKPEG